MLRQRGISLIFGAEHISDYRDSIYEGPHPSIVETPLVFYHSRWKLKYRLYINIETNLSGHLPPGWYRLLGVRLGYPLSFGLKDACYVRQGLFRLLLSENPHSRRYFISHPILFVFFDKMTLRSIMSLANSRNKVS